MRANHSRSLAVTVEISRTMSTRKARNRYDSSATGRRRQSGGTAWLQNRRSHLRRIPGLIVLLSGIGDVCTCVNVPSPTCNCVTRRVAVWTYPSVRPSPLKRRAPSSPTMLRLTWLKHGLLFLQDGRKIQDSKRNAVQVQYVLVASCSRRRRYRVSGVRP